MADEAYHSGDLSASYREEPLDGRPLRKELDLVPERDEVSRKSSPKLTTVKADYDSPTSDYASGNLASMTESEGYVSMPLTSLDKKQESMRVVYHSRSGSPCVIPAVAENVEVVADDNELADTNKRKNSDDDTGTKGVYQVIRVPTIVSTGPHAKRRHVGSPERLDEHSSVTITLTNNTSADMSVGRARTPARVNFQSVSELSKSDRPMLRAAGKEDSEQRSPQYLQRSPVASPMPVDSIPSRGSGGSDKVSDKKEGGKQNALLQVSEAHLAILPDEDGDTPLHLSVIHENLSLTKYLVKLIVGVYLNLDIANNMRQTPLHLAVITRQPQMVQLLNTSGSSVNFPDRRGNTSLHLAAERRDVRILQLLAKATSPLPDFNCKNFSGLTAVHVATKEASIDVLKFLFQNGANKNAQDACSGRTALHYAVESENFTLVNYLLESGCNVNSATFAGNTPLHIAAGRRLKELVALLMAYGANPAIANGEGDFPSDLPASLLMQRAKMNAN